MLCREEHDNSFITSEPDLFYKICARPLQTGYVKSVLYSLRTDYFDICFFESMSVNAKCTLYLQYWTMLVQKFNMQQICVMKYQFLRVFTRQIVKIYNLLGTKYLHGKFVMQHMYVDM